MPTLPLIDLCAVVDMNRAIASPSIPRNAHPIDKSSLRLKAMNSGNLSIHFGNIG